MQIHTIDVGYMNLAGAANAFLVRGEHGDVLVECGPAVAWPMLVRGLQSIGVNPKQVAHLVLTHIHLDHAGAAGHVALHGVQVQVHPFGAPHLMHPEKLLASSRRVHGAAYDTLYGDLLAVPQAQVHSVHDGERVEVCGLRFQALHTPGHARHHIVWLLEQGDQRHAFMGDLAGILVPNSQFIAIPTPPPEFDAPAWQASLLRVIQARPTHLWLTHGGCTAQDAVASTIFLNRALHRLEQETEWLRALVAQFATDAEALATYRDLEIPFADRDGVSPTQREAFLDQAFFMMNMRGARRAFAPRPA